MLNPQTDTPYAAARLAVTLALMTVGACGMYIVPVALPAVQAEFGVARADAALPYSLLMIGFGIGGLIMGRLADRYGVMVPLLIGAAGGNIIEVQHQRVFGTASIKSPEVEFVIETRDRDHTHALIAELQAKGVTAALQ